MTHPTRTTLRCAALALWAVLVLALVGWTVRAELDAARAEFETRSRIAHRLLTQRAEQHDALLAALVALQRSSPDVPSALWTSFARLVAAGYPQIAAIERAAPGAGAATLAGIPAPGLAEAVARRGPGSGPELGLAPAPDGSFRLLRATPDGVVFALRIAPQHLLDATELAPLALTLSSADGQRLWRVPEAAARTSSRRGFADLQFEKQLASRSQPLLLRTEAPALSGPLPWARGLVSALLLALLCGGGVWAIEQQRARALAQRQLTLAHAMRVNTLGEVASGMAHELNQPLAAILATSQALARLLADDPPDLATSRTAADQLAQQAQRAAAIVRRLREFIAPQAGDAREALPVDLNRVVVDALALLAATLHERRVQVRTELAAGLPAVRGDAVAFEQVVVNLVLNAADALQPQPEMRREVRVSTAHEAGRVLLRVADRGDGIAPQALARVFEPFFTTKPHREGSGLGLGLTVCEAIVQQAGGGIAAENIDGGARFTVQLPAVARSTA